MSLTLGLFAWKWSTDVDDPIWLSLGSESIVSYTGDTRLGGSNGDRSGVCRGCPLLPALCRFCPELTYKNKIVVVYGM
jgi:hypothetical protein